MISNSTLQLAGMKIPGKTLSQTSISSEFLYMTIKELKMKPVYDNNNIFLQNCQTNNHQSMPVVTKNTKMSISLHQLIKPRKNIQQVINSTF
jgi:hypothetical protein